MTLCVYMYLFCNVPKIKKIYRCKSWFYANSMFPNYFTMINHTIMYLIINDILDEVSSKWRTLCR